MKKILYFDGICNLCNKAVDFVIKHDKHNKIYFAPLQGETAKALNIKFENLDESDQSVIFQNEYGRVFDRSTAVIYLGVEIFSLGFLLYPILLIPKFIRDPIYRFVASRRYSWFGKRETCRLPSPEEREKFLP